MREGAPLLAALVHAGEGQGDAWGPAGAGEGGGHPGRAAPPKKNTSTPAPEQGLLETLTTLGLGVQSPGGGAGIEPGKGLIRGGGLPSGPGGRDRGLSG